MVRSTLLQSANETGKVGEDGGEGEIPLNLDKEAEDCGKRECGGIYKTWSPIWLAAGRRL